MVIFVDGIFFKKRERKKYEVEKVVVKAMCSQGNPNRDKRPER